MEILTKFLIEEAFIMIPALWIVIEAVKKTEKVDSKWLPLILLGLSVAFTPLVLGGYTPDNIVQAILVAGAEMLGYQIIDKVRE